MFYLHMAPPPSTSSGSGGGASRLPTPSRPKSAGPAICVPTMQSSVPQVVGRSKADVMATMRPAAHVGFSPRAPVAPRPTIGPAPGALRTSFGSFQRVLQAKSPLAQHRYTEQAGETPKEAALEPEQRTNDSSSAPTVANSLVASTATANVFHAMTARKTAEENAKQLARRLAHFRAQEEKVLREVQLMKQRLENLLVEQEKKEDEEAELDTNSSPKKSPVKLAARRPLSATNASRTVDVSTPRSREQLQVLMKQRRGIEAKKMEAARQQKERRQAALEMQKQKEAAEQSRKALVKERIRQERQRALDQRAAKQHQLLDVLEQQHHARLRQEQVRELAATQLVNEMKEEEKNIALRLEALRVHQDHIKRGLEITFKGSSQQPSTPRPTSARAAPPRSHRVTSPRIEPFASVDADNL